MNDADLDGIGMELWHWIPLSKRKHLKICDYADLLRLDESVENRRKAKSTTSEPESTLTIDELYSI